MHMEHQAKPQSLAVTLKIPLSLWWGRSWEEMNTSVMSRQESKAPPMYTAVMLVQVCFPLPVTVIGK